MLAIFKTKFSKFLILLLLAILFLHISASLFYLYWKIWWFDIAMHFLGGFWVGALAVWFFNLSGKISSGPPAIFIIFLALGIVALAGILWEFSEFIFDHLAIFGHNLRLLQQQGVADTMSDLFFDLIGGLSAGLIFVKKFFNDKNGKQI